MAVRINFNEAAAKTHTALIMNERAMTKCLLRLSTGVRILSAADDAAGLFISDMLAVVASAYDQGNRNIQTGISALQIAESAAGQIYDKLQEIYTRAQSAANDINDPNARSALQNEIENFIDAIQKIASDTEYNGIKLLDGTFTNKYIHYGPRKDQVVTVNISSIKATDLGAYIVNGNGSVTSGTGAISSLTTTNFYVDSSDYLKVYGQTVLGTGTSYTTGLVDAATVASNINNNSILQEAGIEATAKNSSTANTFTEIVTITSGTASVTNINLRFFIGNSSTQIFSITGLSNSITLQDLVNEINSVASAKNANITASAEDGKLVLKTSNGETIGIQVEVTLTSSATFTVNLDQLIQGATAQTFSGTSGTAYAVKVGTLQIAGVDTYAVSYSGISTSNQGLYLSVSSGSYATFNNLNAIDVTTNSGAETAILIAKKALQKVDIVRTEIGAIMNNLQSIYDAQKVAYDNTKEAESVIRNTDYAKEIAEFTTYQIRMQSTIAMLAQANTLPQLVLQLLR